MYKFGGSVRKDKSNKKRQSGGGLGDALLGAGLGAGMGGLGIGIGEGLMSKLYHTLYAKSSDTKMSEETLKELGASAKLIKDLKKNKVDVFIGMMGKSSAPAFAIRKGLGRKRNAIVIDSGMLGADPVFGRLPKSKKEHAAKMLNGIVGHELGHIHQKSLTPVGFAGTLGTTGLGGYLGYKLVRSRQKKDESPWKAAPGALAGGVVGGLAGYPLMSFFNSRIYERGADRYASKMNPEAAVYTLKEIKKITDKTPVIFRKQWLSDIFSKHPATSERIREAEKRLREALKKGLKKKAL